MNESKVRDLNLVLVKVRGSDLHFSQKFIYSTKCRKSTPLMSNSFNSVLRFPSSLFHQPNLHPSQSFPQQTAQNINISNNIKIDSKISNTLFRTYFIISKVYAMQQQPYQGTVVHLVLPLISLVTWCGFVEFTQKTHFFSFNKKVQPCQKNLPTN